MHNFCIAMGDRSSTRSATRRTTPQPPPKPFTHRSNAPQNPPRRIARSIRSTSRGISDSEASLQDAKRRPKNAGKTTITENAAINRDSSKARKLRGFNQSRVLKGNSQILTSHRAHCLCMYAFVVERVLWKTLRNRDYC